MKQQTKVTIRHAVLQPTRGEGVLWCYVLWCYVLVFWYYGDVVLWLNRKTARLLAK